MESQMVLTVEVVQPYTDETLEAFGVEPGTASEYAFCLGWQDGALNHVPSVEPVSAEYLMHYRSGWALGSLNRIVWLFQGACQLVTETE